MSGDWLRIRFVIWAMAACTLVVVGAIAIVGSGAQRAKPAPAVTVVTLANGAKVTCITVDKAISCDWSTFVSAPGYKAAKP